MVRFDTFEQAHQFVKRLATLNLDDGWKSSQKGFRANCRIGDMHIIVNGDTMSGYKPLRDVLNAMSSHCPEGTAAVDVVSASDLGAFFKENGLEGCIQQ